MLSLVRENVSVRRQAELMVGLRHQAIVQVLRDEPQIVAMLLGRIGFETPSGSYPVIADSDLSYRDADQLKELRADNVFLFPGMDETAAVVVEVQTTWPDHERTLAWPCYVTRARAVHDCKAYMLVIATSMDASRGSRRPIEIGQRYFDLLPHVVGGERGFPGPGGPVFAAELTILNILIGRLDLSIHEARVLALTNIQWAPRERRLRYLRYMRAFIPQDVRIDLEELMETLFKDAYLDGLIKEGIEQGIGQGEEGALLAVLGARGFAVPTQIRALISACSDPDQLELWISRAATASTVDEVFA
jgi:hypothetical protein